MTDVVLDASVAVKWAFPGEDLVVNAVRLLTEFVEGRIRFIVPDIFWAELANVAWKGVRQRKWSRGLAEQAIDEMSARQLPTVSSRVLLAEAFRIACDYDRSVYDSLYVALADSHNCLLVTADHKLANALASSFPVRWLGSL